MIATLSCDRCHGEIFPLDDDPERVPQGAAINVVDGGCAVELEANGWNRLLDGEQEWVLLCPHLPLDSP